MENLVQLFPIIGVILFIICFIWAKKSNPDGGRKITYYGTKDVFRTEKCPKCMCKMKKTWEKEPFDILGFTDKNHQEFTALPVFACKKCGYEIKG